VKTNVFENVHGARGNHKRFRPCGSRGNLLHDAIAKSIASKFIGENETYRASSDD
jgi:hypothetical protein